VPPLQQLRPSAIVEEAKVVKVDPRNGVYLDVGVPRVHAFAHISRLSDKKVDNLAGETGPFKIDSMHRVRVLGYSAIDGLFSVSLEESTLSQPFLRMEDVNPGELVDGTIEELPVKGDGVSGILLRLAEGIRGFVPADHLADVKLKHPERKYRPGMKVKARVLSTNTDKRSIYLTMKKSLVGSEATPWTSFDDLQVGGQSPGTITKLTPSGAWIQFYGEVRAFLPVGEMSEAFIRDPREHFRVGQVVSVHIISVDQDNKRMLVSCKDPASNSKERELKFKELKVGQIVSASIIELAKDLVTLDLDDGIQGHLRVSHLTDGSEKKNNSALSKLRAGMKLQDLVILQKLAGTRAVRLSNKPTLVKAARKGKLPTSLDQLKQGKKVDGFISSVTATGIFVEFGDNFTGLIPVSGMPDTMRQLKMQNFGMQTGQSVTAAVWKIYLADNRFTLTLREDEFVQSAKDGPADAPRAPRELENPVDSKLTNINELTIGTQTFARVNAVKELQLNISLADNVNGRIHVTEVFKDLSEIDDPKKPLQTIKHNSTLPVTVIGLHDARTYKFLPIGHRQSVHPVYECSRKQSDTSEPYTLSLLKLTEGEERLAFIYKYTNSQALASLSPDINGTIDVVDLASMDVDYQRAFPIGSAIQVKIRKIDADKNKLYLVPASARSWSERTIEEGRVYVGHVRRSHAEGLDIELAKNVWGMVPLTELADDYDQARPESWSARDAVKVKVLARLENQDGLILSARPSLTSSSTESIVVKDRHVTGNADVKTCEVIRGYVKKVSKQGMLVRLGWNATAQIPVHELADAYVKNFASVFKPRQLVTGKITKADADDGHHKMSLRDSVVKDTNFKPQLNFADIEVGQIVDAVVVKVESYGVFVLVRNSRNIRGLCHVKELASTRVEDPSKLYSEGDKVKAKIIKLDMAKRHVNFSLKAMHFQDIAEGDVEQGDGEDADEDHEMGGVDLDNVLDADSEDEEAGADGEMEVVQEVSASKKRISSAGLKTTGFDWTGTADAEDEDAPQPGVGEELPKKKRRKVEIQVDKTGDLDKLGPQSVSDFERLLLGQPNSSALWIQYMAFQLGLSEVDKAREVAERALKTIHMREEEEKMNIWTALLNLENTYGGEESLEGVFERACEYSDKKEVSQRLASIYIDSSKHKVCLHLNL
jgi:rRNA biogenesis protein RRP5